MSSPDAVPESRRITNSLSIGLAVHGNGCHGCSRVQISLGPTRVLLFETAHSGCLLTSGTLPGLVFVTVDQSALFGQLPTAQISMLLASLFGTCSSCWGSKDLASLPFPLLLPPPGLLQQSFFLCPILPQLSHFLEFLRARAGTGTPW